MKNKIIWHPYPEEKPFFHKEYFVTVAYKTKPSITKICGYTCGKFLKNDEKIVAWTEKPEPYKKEQKDNFHRRHKMTKAELIKALEGLPDDTDLYVPSIEFPGDLVPVWYVQVDCDGSNGCQPEANILGSD